MVAAKPHQPFDSAAPSPGGEPAHAPCRSYGSFLKWLGRKSHRSKLLRTPVPPARNDAEPLVRCANELFAWRTVEYPGRYAMLAHVLGISWTAARRYYYPGVRVPQKHRDRMAQYARAKAAALLALAALLESARQK